MISDVGLPTVVRDLLSFLGTSSLVRIEDARRAWSAEGPIPDSASAAIERLVSSGLITVSQAAMLGKSFASAQRERILGMLEAARGRGLVSTDDVESVPEAFEHTALKVCPTAYLIEHGLLTAVQAESLRAAKPYEGRKAPNPIAAPTRRDTASASSVPTGDSEANLSFGAVVAQAAREASRVGGTLTGFAACLALTYGALLTTEPGARPGLWPVDDPWRTLLFSWVTRALVGGTLFAALFRSLRSLSTERTILALPIVVLASGDAYQLLDFPSTFLEVLMVFAGLCGLRWVSAASLAGPFVAYCGAIAALRVAITHGVLLAVATSDTALDTYAQIGTQRSVSAIATKLGLMVLVPQVFIASLAVLLATVDVWHSVETPREKIREVARSRVAFAPIAMAVGASVSALLALLMSGDLVPPPVLTVTCWGVASLVLFVVVRKAIASRVPTL